MLYKNIINAVIYKYVFKFFIPEGAYKKLLNSLFSIYVVYTICRVLFYLLNKNHFQDVTFKDIVSYCLSGLIFDTVGILYTNVLFIFLMILPLKIRYQSLYKKICHCVFIITNSIFLIPNVADIRYYNFIQKRTSFSFFSEFKHQENWYALIVSFVKDFWYLFLIWIILIICINKVYLIIESNTSYKKSESYFTYYTRSILYFFVTILFFVIGVRGGIATSTRPITMSNAGQYAKKNKDQNIILNSTFTILKSIELKTLPDVQYFDDQELLNKLYNTKFIPNGKKKFKYDNVIILIVESLGKEPIGFFNRDTKKHISFTPFIDSLCKESLVFNQSYANGRQSIDALPAIICGIPRIYEPFVTTSYYDNNIESLSYILKSKGYATSFFHGSNYGAMGFWAFLKQNGVDSYYSRKEYSNDADYDGIWGIWDHKFLKFCGDKLNSFKTPFFSIIFSLSSHHPYKLPKNFISSYSDSISPFYKTLAYTDDALKMFFRQISKMPWYDNTLFVITGDHCQTFAVEPEYKTEEGLFKVPIIYYSPKRSIKKKVSNKVTQHIDILPTILDYLSYEKPVFSLGQSALIEDSSHCSINTLNGNYIFTSNEYCLIFNSQQNKSESLYDINNDKLFKNNLVEKLPQVKIKLELKSKAFIQQVTDAYKKDKMKIK